MTYKTILVHLHDSRRARRLLDTAIPIARQMGSHLIGLSVVPPFVVMPSTETGGATVTVEQHRHAYSTEMAALRNAFAVATKNSDLQTEWREADAGLITAAGTIVAHARTADLVIVSQQDPDWIYSSMLEQPDRVVIESGRPLLLVPNTGKIGMPAKRITIAWNGRRESVRAVFDALPLLKLADDVIVVWINPEDDRMMASDLPAAAICATLARHGVKCQGSQASAFGADVGVELLHQASAFGSELLVMGCYGHSRWREFILGGASRDVLKEARVVVLMSH
jgi:nucleotide-binding universal stress UspA family protein